MTLGKNVSSLVEGLKSAGVSLLTVVFTIILDLITTRLVIGDVDLGPREMAIRHGIFSVQYELILVSFGMLFTAHFSRPTRERGKLSSGWMVLVVAFIIVLGLNAIWPQPTNWFTILLPDIVGGITIAWSVYAVRGA